MKIEEKEINAPYELPDGWQWTRLGDCASLISKGTTPKGGKDAYIQDGVNFLRIENLNDDGSINLDNIAHISKENHEIHLKRSILQAGDVLISIAGTLGKVGFVTEKDLPLNTNQAIAFVRLYKDIFSEKYLKYAIESPFVNAELLSKTKVTSIPNLTLEIISNCKIPLPPLPEQKRIVSRIESMFVKLDEATEKAESALESFETRKAAILHKAFTGELTAKWRKDNGVSDSWEEKRFDEFCLLKRGFDLPSKQRIEGKYPLVSSSGIIDSHNEAKVKAPGVVTGRSGSIGKVFYIEEDFFPLNTTLYSEKLFGNNAKYIYYYFLQFDFKTYSSSTAVPTLNRNQFSAVPVKVPTLDEQKEIVRILDSVLEKERIAKEAAETVLSQISLLKKSILARAFRGEL